MKTMLKLLFLTWLLLGLRLCSALLGMEVGLAVWFIGINVIAIIALRQKHGRWLWQKRRSIHL